MSSDSTLNGVSDEPTTAEQMAAIGAIAPKMEAMSDALHSATKASASSTFLDAAGVDLKTEVEGLVNEIVYTVKAVVEKLGLGK